MQLSIVVLVDVVLAVFGWRYFREVDNLLSLFLYYVHFLHHLINALNNMQLDITAQQVIHP